MQHLNCTFIMHSFGGGAEAVALELGKHLDASRFTVTICCTRYIPALAKRIPAGVRFSMPQRPGLWAALRHAAHLFRLAREADVVLGSLELQSIFWAALLTPHKALAWLHKDIAGYLQGRGRLYGYIYRFLLGGALRRCHAVACVSEGIAASSARLWPDLQTRLRVLWNPVNLAALRQRAQAPLPQELAACFGLPVILGVGRLERQKVFEVLIEAHAILRQRGLKHHLCIAGEGSQRPMLEKSATALNVADTVFLPGFLDPCPLMREAAVLALSSDFEGFSLVLVEALALGLPVVSTNCPSGPAEVLDHGRFGRLTPVGDAHALANALEDILCHPPSAAFRAAGQQRARIFDLDVTIGAWEQLLLQTAKTKNKVSQA